MPCTKLTASTTAAKDDESNKVRENAAVTGRMKEVFYNYRATKDNYRRPQHSVG